MPKAVARNLSTLELGRPKLNSAEAGMP
jgi:hypothetical protein